MYESLYYLTALGIAICGLGILDYRYRLAYFAERRATIIAVMIGIAVFVIWDALGIGLGIFLKGDSPYFSGVVLAPEFPLEELFFLFLLSYNALLLWRGAEKIWPRT